MVEADGRRSAFSNDALSRLPSHLPSPPFPPRFALALSTHCTHLSSCGTTEKVKKAIIASKERTGLSLPALKKKLKVTDATKRFVNAALRSGVAKGVLVKNKGKYKVSAEAKKAPVSFTDCRGGWKRRGGGWRGAKGRTFRAFLHAAPIRE